MVRFSQGETFHGTKVLPAEPTMTDALKVAASLLKESNVESVVIEKRPA